MEEKPWTGILLGYSSQSKGYKVYNPQTGKVETSRDVRFYEEESYYPQVLDGASFEDEGSNEVIKVISLGSTVTSVSGIKELERGEITQTRLEGRERNIVVRFEGSGEKGEAQEERAEEEEPILVMRRRSTRESRPPKRLSAKKKVELLEYDYWGGANQHEGSITISRQEVVGGGIEG